ncbi:hypothetical protein [Phytoactinopolyspora limicola]|uniref:hypothetical protein n=1 Tax=Phytoactinopolyspora limicola TaxID=2715536 RepID=UPI0014083306|nr:hypothetical protein [Phytoactinopolyspora limicola]
MGTVPDPACLGIEPSEEPVVLTWPNGVRQATVAPDRVRRGRLLAEAVADALR